MSAAAEVPRDVARPEPPVLTFARVQLRDMREANSLAQSWMDPRIARYALGPPASARRAQLKGWLAGVPWIGGRIAQPEHFFWVASAGRRVGLVRLHRGDAALSLEIIALAPDLRGTGAADVVLRFIDEQARAAGYDRVDLYVDRRNYRAVHLYRRAGFVTTPERRFIFEVPRSTPPIALTALPRHGVAALLGSVSAGDVAHIPAHLALEQGLVATLTVTGTAAVADVDSTVREVFRGTLARSVRVTLPFEGNVQGGCLVAVLHRMEKVLA